ncbi:MAG: DUF4433 domain-containing protein [Lacisediminihabitans sp.]
MTEECIHGLDFTRCDLCSPKAAPPQAKATTTTPRSRAPRATAGRASTASATPRSSQRKKPIIIGEQRIHHLTHIDNLASILSEGLHSDASASLSTRPQVDISSEDTRVARRGIAVTGASMAATVADYVPFFLSPNAALWEGIRSRTPDPRISATARRLPAAEFVLLVSTVKQVVDVLPEGSIALTDGDAADPRSRFATTGDDWERMLRRLVGGDESGALTRAEFLIHDTVPFELFSLVGVANDKARTAVRAILASSAHSPRLAVHPPWFALPETL